MDTRHGKASMDIDLITINQERHHVISSCVFMDQILFFSIENDYRLHFQYLNASAQFPTIKPLLFTSNIIQLHAHNDTLFILTQRQLLFYQPLKNKTVHLFSAQQCKQDNHAQLLIKLCHYAYNGTQFIAALSASLDASFLIFYFITQQDQITTLTPFQISDFVIIDIEIEAVQLTAQSFLEKFNLVVARPRQTALTYTGRVTGQNGPNVSISVDLNGINEQCSQFARSAGQYVCFSSVNSASQTIATFYRFGLWGRADFVNEKLCRLECSSPVERFHVSQHAVVVSTRDNDLFVIDAADFYQEFAELRAQQGRRVKRIETISREVRRLVGRILWSDTVGGVFTLIATNNDSG